MGIQREEVTKRVAILNFVQSPHDGMTAAALEPGLGICNRPGNRGHGSSSLTDRWLPGILRWHRAQVELIEDLLPGLQVFMGRNGIGESIECPGC